MSSNFMTEWLFSRKASKVDVLDALRVIATLFVFLLHGREFIPGLNGSDTFVGKWMYFPAWSGVWIFLFLSAYLFGLNMMRNKYSIINAAGGVSVNKLLGFYISRLFRLAPLYYLYLALFDLFHGGDLLINYSLTVLKSIFFLSNGVDSPIGIGHLWYMSTALQLYVLMPFIWYGLEKLSKSCGRLILLFIGFLFLGLIIRLTLFYYNYDWYRYVYTSFAANLDFVVCGILAARIIPSLSIVERDKFLSAGGFFLLVVFNMYLYATGRVEIYQYVLPTLYILFTTYLIASFRCKERQHGIINSLAKYSYAFYVFHIAVFVYVTHVLSHFGLNRIHSITSRYVIFFVLSSLITLAFSYLFTQFTTVKRKER